MKWTPVLGYGTYYFKGVCFVSSRKINVISFSGMESDQSLPRSCETSSLQLGTFHQNVAATLPGLYLGFFNQNKCNQDSWSRNPAVLAELLEQYFCNLQRQQSCSDTGLILLGTTILIPQNYK